MTERARGWFRAVVCLVATLPPAWLGGLALGLHLPLEESTRLALGFLGTIPGWVALMVLASLDSRGWRAAAVLTALTAGLGAALW